MSEEQLASEVARITKAARAAAARSYGMYVVLNTPTFTFNIEHQSYLGTRRTVFAGTLERLLRRGLVRRAWGRWQGLVEGLRGGDFHRGLKQIMREEAVMLFAVTFRALRKVGVRHDHTCSALHR